MVSRANTVSLATDAPLRKEPGEQMLSVWLPLLSPSSPQHRVQERKSDVYPSGL